MPPAAQLRASREFVDRMAARRSVRSISSEPVAFEVIENAIRCASLAPSGANQQPWKFIVVKDSEIKRKIREAAEAEERESYDHRMPADWLEALAPLGTDWHKEFLETAPYLIVVFRIDFGLSQTAEGVTKNKTLLRAGVRRHRDGISSRGVTHERPGDPDSHSEPDGISFAHPRSAEKRASVCFDSGRPARSRRDRSGDREEKHRRCDGNQIATRPGLPGPARVRRITSGSPAPAARTQVPLSTSISTSPSSTRVAQVPHCPTRQL